MELRLINYTSKASLTRELITYTYTDTANSKKKKAKTGRLQGRLILVGPARRARARNLPRSARMILSGAPAVSLAT